MPLCLSQMRPSVTSMCAEDISRGKLALLALRGLVGVRRERRDVHQRGNARIGPGVRDERAAIGVPDKHHWAADPPQASRHGGDVARERVETVLRSHHLVTLGQQRRDQFAEA